MGMRVLLAGAPVRRPAGVPNPCPHQGEVPIAPGEGAGEVLELPNLSYLLYPAFPLKGQPRRIVTTILEVPETLHKDLDTPLFTGVTNYAAQGFYLPAYPGMGSGRAEKRHRASRSVSGPGRCFVPGVTAEICHRPDDRPKPRRTRRMLR